MIRYEIYENSKPNNNLKSFRIQIVLNSIKIQIILLKIIFDPRHLKSNVFHEN